VKVVIFLVVFVKLVLVEIACQCAHFAFYMKMWTLRYVKNAELNAVVMGNPTVQTVHPSRVEDARKSSVKIRTWIILLNIIANLFLSTWFSASNAI